MNHGMIVVGDSSVRSNDQGIISKREDESECDCK